MSSPSRPRASTRALLTFLVLLLVLPTAALAPAAAEEPDEITAQSDDLFLWPSNVTEGYDIPLEMDATTHFADPFFVDGDTTVAIRDSHGDIVPGAVSGVVVWHESSLSFEIVSALTAGSYSVEVTAGSETRAATLLVAPPPAVIISDGPLTRIAVGALLDCDVRRDHHTLFFADNACGTFLYDGDLHGPTVPAGPSTFAYEPVSQTLTGTGTVGDPWIITTVVDVTDGDHPTDAELRITQTDTYVEGDETYRTDVHIHNQGTAATNAALYRSADCMIAGDDASFGDEDPATGDVACVQALWDDQSETFFPGTGRVQWEPITPGSSYIEDYFSAVWSPMIFGELYQNECECDTYLDSGAGISWPLSLDAGASATFSHLTRVTELSSDFDPDQPQIWLWPDALPTGYSTPQTIDVDGFNTSFEQGVTAVEIHDDVGPIAGAVGDIEVHFPDWMTFELQAQLDFGEYEVHVSTGDEHASATLMVFDHVDAWVEPSFLPEGYATPQPMTVFGDNTSFEQGVTEVAIVDAWEDTEIAGAADNVQVQSAEDLTFDLVLQLAPGFYFAEITTGDEVLGAFFEVGEAGIFVWPNQLEEGYDTPVWMDVFGQGTDFDTETTVEIRDDDGPVEGAVANVDVFDPGSLTFDLVVSLPAGDYTVAVTTGSGEFTDVLWVIGPSPCSLELPVNNELTNMGFETGDFAGWTVGHVFDEVDVTQADDFTAPWEGEWMARLGGAYDSNQDLQTPGPNEICQDFVVTQSTERFAFNAFTYDYTGFDHFGFDLTVTDPATGETIAQYDQQAWGSDTELKTSGWRGVELNLAGRIGQTVRLTITAGGTSDDLYPFWAYVDSAEDKFPEPVAPSAVITTPGGSASVMVDPQTGQVVIAMPVGDIQPITVTMPLSCADEGTEPTGAHLLLNGQPFAMTQLESGAWTATIPASQVESGSLSVEISCPDEPTKVEPLGEIWLYDPAGDVTDAETDDPIEGAEVFLYKMDGWVPDTEGQTDEDGDCRTVETREGGEAGDWSGEPPADPNDPDAFLVPAHSVEIDPNVNPFITNAAGRYAWDVAMGCWFVIVHADGYVSQVSPVVGVPPEVTDLDIALEPEVDSEAPTWPVGAQLNVTTPSPTTAQLSWPAAEDNVGVTGYTVYIDGTLVTTIGDPTQTSVTLSGLTAGTTYTFAVRAFDAANNLSAPLEATATMPEVSEVVRLSGADRFATAVEISKATFDPGVDAVYIATGMDFPDALAGGAAAALDGGPILLVQRDQIPAVTATELQRLAPAQIYVLGGTGVVSEAVRTQLAAYTTGTVTRLSGPDRYATAVDASAKRFPADVDAVYIATGVNFPDALAGVPAAGIDGAPVLLVPGTSIPDAVKTELLRLNPLNIYVLGGTGVVSTQVEAELAAYLR